MAVIEVKPSSKNTWAAKLKRTVTAFLPVSKNRRGQCLRCGACCKLPNVCPWLKFDAQGKAICKIYALRSMNCRKYPRTESEHITQTACGIHFLKRSENPRA